MRINVATKLINEHIKQTIIHDIKIVINIGYVFLASSVLNVIFVANFSTNNPSKINAIIPIIGNSYNAIKKI